MLTADVGTELVVSNRWGQVSPQIEAMGQSKHVGTIAKHVHRDLVYGISLGVFLDFLLLAADLWIDRCVRSQALEMDILTHGVVFTFVRDPHLRAGDGALSWAPTR